MIVIRCTAELLERLSGQEVSEGMGSTSRLGDLIRDNAPHAPGPFVLAMTRETSLPVVVTSRDIRTFPERLSEQVGAMLESYGVPTEAVAREREAMRDVVYARTDDRSNVGVLIEFQRLLRYDLSEPSDLTLLDLSLRLASTPIAARMTFPMDATCRVFGVERPPRDWWQQRPETGPN